MMGRSPLKPEIVLQYFPTFIVVPLEGVIKKLGIVGEMYALKSSKRTNVQNR